MNIGEVRAREEALRLRVRELDDEARKAFYRQFNQRLKDPDTYAVLNYLFITGLHHFYLGRYWRGLVNVLVLCAGVALLFAGMLWAGLLAILAITILELGELFQAEAIVTDYNNGLMEELLHQSGATSGRVTKTNGH